MTDLQLLKITIQRLKVLGLGSQKEIGKMLGYSNESSFSQVVNGRVPMPHNIFERIGQLNPEIKKFINESRSSSAARLEAVPLRLADPQGFEATGEKIYELADKSLMMQVPIIPQRAYAGYLRGFADPEFYEDLETLPVIIDSRHKGTYIAFEVKGDSMVCLDTPELAERSIWPGRIAVGRDLARDRWKYKLHTHNTDTWIIVHKTEGILIKEIVDQDIDEMTITVHSLNPEYNDQLFELDDIEQIFSVQQIVKRRK